MKRLGIAIVAFLVLLGGPTARPVAGQVCIGDCDGNGAVDINEIVLAVAIVLGATSLDQCPVLGPPPVGIDKVVAAVNGALCACGPCPTPPPPRTPTATPAITSTAPPTPTVPPTATPEPPVFESVWREDNARLGTSTCTREINTAVREALGSVDCPLDVTRRGSAVEVVDCDGFAYGGTIDPAGLFRAQLALTERIDACSVAIAFDLGVNLSRSPATATYRIGVDFSGACGGLRDCSLTATTRWTRQSGTIASASTVTGRHGLTRALAPNVFRARRGVVPSQP